MLLLFFSIIFLGRIAKDLTLYYDAEFYHPESNWGSFRHHVVYEDIARDYKDFFQFSSIRNPIMR